MEQKFHVISIDPDQQAALKFCLFHLFSLKVMFCLNSVMRNPRPEQTESAADAIITAFSDYDVLTNQWPIISEIKAKGTKKLYYFDENNFKTLRTAVERYDKETASIMLGEDKAAMINLQMPSIKKLMDKSENFEYSMSEIKLALGKK